MIIGRVRELIYWLSLSMILTAFSPIESLAIGNPLCDPFLSKVGHVPSTASARLAKASPESRGFWQSYEYVFNLKMQDYYFKRLNFYLEAKRMGHPYIKFLESLGFEFSVTHVSVPRLVSIFDQLEEKMERLIEAKAVSRMEALFPILLIELQGKNRYTEHYTAVFSGRYGDEISFKRRSSLNPGTEVNIDLHTHSLMIGKGEPFFIQK